MEDKIWNWQSADWPHFTYDPGALAGLEREFLRNAGVLTGSIKHFDADDRSLFTVQLMIDEAQKTSEIEGEYLDRDSLQSSIRKNLGLALSTRTSSPAEVGIAEMMVDLFRHFDEDLTHQQLYIWHAMICRGRQDVDVIGGYRSHDEAMQIVSNRLDITQPIVHFEAPPSASLTHEMGQFLNWFNSKTHMQSASRQTSPLLPLARAGIAHFYFLSIHPFEDGNGRIARAIAEKVLSQDVGQAAIISLSKSIEANKKQYYAALEAHNHTLALNDWLVYFAGVVLEAQATSITHVEFLIAKAKFYDRYSKHMNERQTKVVARLFEAGPDGFAGGLSARNYQSIAKTSSATATRDLHDLVTKGVLERSGSLKSTRYGLTKG